MRRTFKPDKRCPTGKRRYRDDLEANKVLKRAAGNRDAGDRAEVRSYPCRQCNGYHLTSQPRKDR